jgi:hypothetical protein
MQRTTLEATVYSGDRCRRGDAQSLALTIEVDSRKSTLQVESGGLKIAGAVGVSVIDLARGAERLLILGISGACHFHAGPQRSSFTAFDIEALAARYQNEDFWRRSMQEGDEEGPER